MRPRMRRHTGSTSKQKASSFETRTDVWTLAEKLKVLAKIEEIADAGRSAAPVHTANPSDFINEHVLKCIGLAKTTADVTNAVDAFQIIVRRETGGDRSVATRRTKQNSKKRRSEWMMRTSIGEPLYLI